MAAIVLVEPDPMARQLLERTLTDAGYETAAVDGPRPALERIRRLRPRLIITELKFSDSDPFDFLSRIRQEEAGATARIIVLTSMSDRRSVIRAVSYRVCEYLLKASFDQQRLLARIRSAIEAEERRHELNTASADKEATELDQVDSGPDPVEILRSLKPAATKSDVLEQIADVEEIEGFAPSVAQVMKIAKSPNASLEQLTRPVMRDQGLAIKILKLANSSVYSRGERIESLQKAILRIGLDGVRQSVLSIAVIDRFSNQIFNEHLNFAHFWEHSIAVGILASRIASHTHAMDSETAFTMGLLHDVGRIIAAQRLDDVYAQVIETAADYNLPLEQVESRMLMLSHADLAANVLRGWHLPDELLTPITLHHLSIANIRQQAPRHVVQCAVLGLANRLAHAALIGSSGNHAIYPYGPFLDALDIKPEALPPILEASVEETAEMRLNLLTVDPNQEWPDVRDRYLQQHPDIDFRPLFVGAEHGAFAMMCRRLRGDAEPQPPNLAIVRVESEHQRAARSSELQEAEAAAGVTDLPTIIISPTGKLRLDAGNMTRRRAVLLNEPIVIPRFLKVAEALAAPAELELSS